MGTDVSLANFQRSMGACIIIGMIVSLGFCTINVLLLTIHTFGKSGPGFSYGFVMSSAIQAALTMVAIAIELQFVIQATPTSTIPTSTSADLTSWSALFYFAYISAASLALQFVFLSIAEGISHEPGGNALFARPQALPPSAANNTFAAKEMADARTPASSTIGAAPAARAPAEDTPFARQL